MNSFVVKRNHSFTAPAWRQDRGLKGKEQQDCAPSVLCIAGNDSSGIAGVSMDARTCQAFSVHGAAVITAITAQNSNHFMAMEAVASEMLEQQIDTALALNPQVIKIGLLCNIEQVRVIVGKLNKIHIPIIYDPVMASSSDYEFLNTSAINEIKHQLLPLCHCVTPNLKEASLFLGTEVDSASDREQAARQLMAWGADSVLIKGGHGNDKNIADYFCSESLSFWMTHKKIHTTNNRGSGCALSSCIASAIVLGYEIRDAIVIARMAMQQGLKMSRSINGQSGPVAIKEFPKGEWPLLTQTPDLSGIRSVSRFPACVDSGTNQSLGLYPIVDSVKWLKRVLKAGVSTAQLRIKHLTGIDLEEAIEQAVALGKHYSCRLFINDHWQLAIKKGAYGVHLGQEDLATANIPSIHQAGLRLGISSHCHYEVARALALRPSYIACGPTFKTNTKQMPWTPHGIAGLSYWQQTLDLPVVAIGGINASNINQVASTGVSGVAMISAITDAPNPELSIQQFMAVLDRRSW